MKIRFCSTLSCLLLLVAIPAPAAAALRIFACEPEWAALADAIGGDRVRTFVATSAQQDPHHIRARPSLLAAMRRSDLVICTGASLEAGWLPILLHKAGRESVQPGRPGNLQAASVVPMLDRPTRIDRAEGDIHPEGNPHIQLNPHNIALVATALAERMRTIDPANADHYQARYEEFSDRWQRAIRSWEKSAQALHGVTVVAHHRSFTYLLDWLEMRLIGSLEPKPGIPPTTAHLGTLLQSLKKTPASAIIRTPYDPDDASGWLAAKAGIPALELPFTVGGSDLSRDLFGLFDHTIALLLEANSGH